MLCKADNEISRELPQYFEGLLLVERAFTLNNLKALVGEEVGLKQGHSQNIL